jgi:hypothetical protein
MTIINGKLKFNQINRECLVKDVKYIIIQISDYLNATKQYTGIFIDYYLYLTVWKNVDIILDYSIGVSSLFYLPILNMDLRSDIYKIYELNRSYGSIQLAMEQRAINKILQHIIGDDCFIYKLN